MDSDYSQHNLLPFSALIPRSTNCGGGWAAKLCLPLATLWNIARQAPLSIGFSRQGYSGGLPFSSPGDLPDPGIKPSSPALQEDSLPLNLFVLPCHYSKNRSLKRSEKVGLKLNIQKTKIMASGPITSWEIDGETVEQ